ncbi:MAG: SRPBCC family protein [Burkholderiaceae bacterium]|jgi:hypothetical protein
MKFNHLVEINDPRSPWIDPLTREQLWRGLVLRAEHPVSFVIGLDSCEIVERFDDGVRRELHFGDLLVSDRVTYEPMERIRYDTQARAEMPAATLVMSIEEPSPGALFVRFEYEIASGALEGSDEALYDDFRKSAYEEADIDTISRIRQLASEGRLDGAMN